MHILLAGAYADSFLNFRGSFINELLGKGHQVTVAAPEFDYDLKQMFLQLGVEVKLTPMSRTGSNPINDLAYFVALCFLFKKTKPDLVLTYAIKPNIWGALAAQFSNVKSFAFVTGLGYAFTRNNHIQQRTVRKIAIFLYRFSTTFNEAVFFLNPEDRDDFLSYGCLNDPRKAFVIDGEGVDTRHFEVAPLPDEPVYLMISRLLGNKGVREYGEAVTIVKKDFPEARFFLVGDFDEGPDGINNNELDRWIEGGLEYLGPTNDIRPIMARSSVFVLPSYREGLPRSVLEALSMGRAVVVSDAPGCRETVDDGENGYLVPVGDVGTLVNRLKILAQDADLREVMGKKGRLKAENRFDVNLIIPVIMRHLGLFN